MTSYDVVRTIRCKNLNVPGSLGKLATAMGKTEANIGNISTVHIGQHYVIRDIDVFFRNKEHLSELLTELAKAKGLKVIEVRDDVLNLHKNGKIKMVNTVCINSLDDLRKVYTPGVAEVCHLIQDEPNNYDIYTSIPHSIAIVTDGTAVLGLGNIGPVAGMPVMEGKAALLYKLVGISGIPILLNTTDPELIVETVKSIAPTFGGIQLEDIASPRCFLIEDRLRKELNIPMMHDDQHGTAVVVLATLLKASQLCRIKIEETTIGLIGLGAAGLTIGRFLKQYTGNPCLGIARSEASSRRHEEHGGIASSFDEIMKKCDVVIATSGVSRLIEPHMIKKGQIILALSNPIPEITPELAIASGAALAADGKTVNNLLGYPGIWRGALDTKARSINFEMYKAAANAIAEKAAEGELVPDVLDCKTHLAVTHGVARAAISSAIAQRQLDADYFNSTSIVELSRI